MSKDLFSGMPDELQELLDDVDKSSTLVEIKLEKRKYGKSWAVISGIDKPNSELKELGKRIKSKMATTGTTKDGKIELLMAKRQNNRTDDLLDILVDEGFTRESIHITSK